MLRWLYWEKYIKQVINKSTKPQFFLYFAKLLCNWLQRLSKGATLGPLDFKDVHHFCAEVLSLKTILLEIDDDRFANQIESLFDAEEPGHHFYRRKPREYKHIWEIHKFRGSIGTREGTQAAPISPAHDPERWWREPGVANQPESATIRQPDQTASTEDVEVPRPVVSTPKYVALYPSAQRIRVRRFDQNAPAGSQSPCECFQRLAGVPQVLDELGKNNEIVYFIAGSFEVFRMSLVYLYVEGFKFSESSESGAGAGSCLFSSDAISCHNGLRVRIWILQFYTVGRRRTGNRITSREANPIL